MSFFPEEELDEEVLGWAKQLWDKVRAHGIKVRAGQVKVWASHFVTLRNTHGSDLVSKVLTWFLLHLGEEFTPQAYSGHLFLKKFDQLLKSMENSSLLEGEIDPLSRELANRLMLENIYPVEIGAKLPEIVEKSRREFREFISQRIAAAWQGLSSPERARDREFLTHVLECSSRLFVNKWMELISKRYGKLESYTYPVMNLAFRPNHPWFREHFWQRWSSEWCGNCNAFNRLLDELLKEKPNE